MGGLLPRRGFYVGSVPGGRMADSGFLQDFPADIMAVRCEVPMLRYAAVIGLVGLFGMRQEPPREWIEATGHRVFRLSDEPGTASLYFHQNPYTAAGDKMVVSTRSGLATITLATRTIKPLVEGRI